MNYQTLVATAALTLAVQASATPAMSVITINTDDPMGYMEWARKSGPAIGKAISATAGGVCIANAGYYAPGELYYWHVFPNHATAMSASLYDEAVMKEAARLKVKRSLSRADAFSVAMAEPGDLAVGDTFANWNLMVSTDDPEAYLQQIGRINAAASDNGFGDVSVAAYSYLTGEQAGNMLAAVSAPSATRLGEFIDQIDSDWMSPIMAELSEIRSYEHGVTMTCTVVHAAN